MSALRFVLAAFLLIGMEHTVSTEPIPDRPFLVSSTFWGGSASERFATVTVDAAGNVYVAGLTGSTNFPRTVSTLPALGGTEVFISKFDPAGGLVFSTVFGGSSSDEVKAIAIDADGNIIVVGDTFSSDLPVVNAIQPAFHRSGCGGEFGGICSDGFVAKIDPTGQRLLFSSYLGALGLDEALDVAVDGAGNIYVTGATNSPTFEGATPLRDFGGTQDAFVAKIPPGGGSFSYFTYLGGSSEESGNGIAVDAAGNVYVTGVTSSQNFPTLNPIQARSENFSTSAFVTKLDPTGSIVYSTYLGGNSQDTGLGIGIDSSGSAYVVGFTWSTNFPTANAQQQFLRGQNDVFVAKLSPSGSSLVYSTFLGGNSREQLFPDLQEIFAVPLDIAVDAAGNAYVSGSTQSNDFPSVFALYPFGGGSCLVEPPIPPFATEPCPDAFVTKLDTTGKLMFSTPIGGSGDDRGRGVAATPDGIVYVVGTTLSPDFPVKAPLQANLAGSADAFIVKISTAPPACQLSAPVQLSPAGGIFEERPTFSWEAVAGADGYAVITSSFADVVLTGTPPTRLLGLTSETSLTPPEPLAPGDYIWSVLPFSSTCGVGRSSAGASFTLPGNCPLTPATQISPVGGAQVNNPVLLRWSSSGPAVLSLSIVVILTVETGQFTAFYATAESSFTIPMTMSAGNYQWFVVTWNSTCGPVISGPAQFRI